MTPEEESICRAYVDAWQREWSALSPGVAKLKAWDEWPDAAKFAQLRCLRQAIAAAYEDAARVAENYRDYASYSQMPKAIAAAIRDKAG
jgi:hypothetical protein